jgi:hypothetical protein
VVRGERLDRREAKVPYNGAGGLPIREEIVAQHGDTIITRNSYGARCLNTPNVLFADIDFPEPFVAPLGCALVALAASGGVVIAWLGGSQGWALAFGGLLCACVLPIVAWIRWRLRRLEHSDESLALVAIVMFAEANPEWNLRVYRTPAGLRLLVTHRPFDPNEPAVQAFFADIGTDPMYVQMCQNQQCFRARLTAKPWRIGIDSHMKPRPGVWPVRPERLAERQAWIAAYEEKAAGYAACEFVEAIGSGIVHSAVAPIVKLHDDLSRATSGLPVA